MNTPHPLGKLAQWRLAIQELDQEVRYRLGKENQAVGAFSHQKTIVKVKDKDASLCHLVASNDENVSALRQHMDDDLRVLSIDQPVTSREE